MRNLAILVILAVVGVLLSACNPSANDAGSAAQTSQPAASSSSGSSPGLGGPAEPAGQAEEPEGGATGETAPPPNGEEEPAPPRDPASLPKMPTPGKPLPTFEFSTLDGQTHSIEEFIGRPLLINMWKINCPPCKAELPEFVRFYAEYKDQGLEIITLNVEDSAGEVKQFMQAEQEMPWVAGYDAGMLARAWRVRGVPTSYFVSPDGVVVDVKLGAASREYLDRLIPEWMGAQ